jgi:hypothetical protein
MHLVAIALVVVHGVVMRGPTQPVCQIGTPCSAPAAHVQLLFQGHNYDVVTQTDSRGRYSVRLRLGTYTVRIQPRPRIGRGVEPTKIVVRRAMRADFSIDTGIR